MRRIEFTIAWRYLLRRRRTGLLSLISFIAIGGVVVGVSALILIIGVMNGLQRDLREKILIGSPDIRVLTWGTELRMPEWRTVIERVQAEAGVEAVAPFTMTQALIVLEGSLFVSPMQLVGVPPQVDSTPRVTDIRDYLVAGAFDFRPRDETRGALVVGQELADKMQLFVGDHVQLLSIANVTISPVSGQPSVIPEPFEVTGVFKTGMYEYDVAYAFTSLASSMPLTGLGDAVTGLEVRTTDRDLAADIADALQTKLGETEYRAEDWERQNSSLFQALKLEKFAMFIILLLIVLVAAFNIVSTLTMLVADKTREIGILRAMGLRATSVRRVFLLQGAFIGTMGTTLGLVIGLSASLAVGRYKLIPLEPEIYFIDHLPVSTQPLDVALIVISSIVISICATLYPSRQAARLLPLEAIRHE